MPEKNESVAIGPWPKGMVNAVPLEFIGLDSLSAAVNIDIDRAGAIHHVRSWAQVDGNDAHSLFTHNGVDYAVIDGVLGIALPQSFQPIASVDGRLAWTVLLDEPVFTDGQTINVIRGLAVHPMFADIRTDEYELMLAQLPGGSHIAYWQGRLLVARGNTLFTSEPLRYGVYDQLRGKFPFEQRIQWIAPLKEGVYVGLRDSVQFLQGSNPLDWERRRVSDRSAPGAAIVATTANMPAMQEHDECAVWFDESGFVVGVPTGQIIRPQAGVLKEMKFSPGTMVVEGDRVTVVFE